MLIVDLHESMERLIKKLMAFILPITCIKEKELVTVDFTNRSQQFSDIELNCSSEARVLITEMEEDVAGSKIAEFYRYKLCII